MLLPMTRNLPPLGVCSWSLKPRDADHLLQLLHEVELRAVQLQLSNLDSPGWNDAPARLRDAGITILSGNTGSVGEDYSTLDTIRETGGIVPDATWPRNRKALERIARTAAEHDIRAVSFHAGFIPAPGSAPGSAPAAGSADAILYEKLYDRLAEVADLFAEHGRTVLLETGQETAPALLRFLQHLGRPNVRVNFDPANMILYGKGDPVEAVRLLLPHIGQVHVKDAIASDRPGVTWGQEVPVGEGEVDWPAFFSVLHEGGYEGPLAIEREAGDDRVRDVRTAATVVRRHDHP